MNETVLRGFALSLGFFFLVAGIVLNFWLYTSFSDTTAYQVTYGATGIGFDITKAIMLPLAVLLFALRYPVLGTIAAVFWFALTSISFGAGFGFMALVQAEAEKQAVISSTKYNSLHADVEAAKLKAQTYEQYAGLDGSSLQSQYDSLQTELANLVAERDKCPRNYFSKCIDPKNAEITATKIKLEPIEKQLQGYQSYQGAITAKSNTLDAISKLDSTEVNNISNIHPMFLGFAKLFNLLPEQVKFWFLFFSAFIAEGLSSYLLLVFSRLGMKKRYYTVQEVEAVFDFVREQQSQLAYLSQQATAHTHATYHVEPDRPKG